jgi:hypothetical protein
MQPDPLGLAGFTDHILSSITAFGPVALVGVFVILGIYGLLRPR